MPKRLTTYQQAQLQIVGYRMIQAKVIEVLGAYSLNTSQWVILGWLSEHPGGMRVSALAEVLVVEIPLATVLIQDLETVGLVTSQKDPEDGRAKIVRLTGRAANLVPQIEAELRSHLKPLVKGSSVADMQTYFGVLQSILQTTLP